MILGAARPTVRDCADSPLTVRAINRPGSIRDYSSKGSLNARACSGQNLVLAPAQPNFNQAKLKRSALCL